MKRLLAVAAIFALTASAQAESLRFTGNADRQDLSATVAALLKAPADFPEGEPLKLELRWQGTVVATRAPAVSGRFSMRLAYYPGGSVRLGESIYNLAEAFEGELEIAYGGETTRWLLRQENYSSMFAQARYKAVGLGFVLPVGFVRKSDDPSRVHTLLTVGCVVADGALQCREPRFTVETSDRRFLPHAGSHEELLPDSMRARIAAVAGQAAVLGRTPPLFMDCCYGAWRCKCTTDCLCNYIFCNNSDPGSCESLCYDMQICTEVCLR
jgi:hypothetical protein